MKIGDIISNLELIAPPSLQESYDNAGLITGQADSECTGVLCCLDSTEVIIQEAIEKKCNLIVAHHPIVFSGLKKINGKNYVERTIIAAIKNDIAIYAIHTNLDNIITGVNGRMADRLNLVNRTVLLPKPSTLKKLFTFVPTDHAEAVKDAIFKAGAGHIGNYSECSFEVQGNGTFKAGEGSTPFVGEPNLRHTESEKRIEVIFPGWLQSPIIAALKKAHPYEEVAYDIISLDNQYSAVGSGLVGELPEAISSENFLDLLKSAFQLKLIKHSAVVNTPIKRVALCGGAGSFLISKSLAVGVDAFVTSDIKYHEFFDADGRMLLCDIGHFESEQFTISLFAEILQEKFPTFAVLKSVNNTNPVYYYF